MSELSYIIEFLLQSIVRAIGIIELVYGIQLHCFLLSHHEAHCHFLGSVFATNAIFHIMHYLCFYSIYFLFCFNTIEITGAKNGTDVKRKADIFWHQYNNLIFVFFSVAKNTANEFREEKKI